MYVCRHIYACTMAHVWWSETTCRIKFSSSTMWALGIELMSGFGAVALTHSAILPLLLVFIHN